MIKAPVVTAILGVKARGVNGKLPLTGASRTGRLIDDAGGVKRAMMGVKNTEQCDGKAVI